MTNLTEHRVTHQFGNWIVRYWLGKPIPDDRLHDLEQTTTWYDFLSDHQSLAEYLIEHLPDANAIEVCDISGTGTVVYRDWP